MKYIEEILPDANEEGYQLAMEDETMNLSKLFELQKALDERITREKGLEGTDLLPMKILALQVELGELANEWRGFKFWSKDQEPRMHKTEHDFWSDEVIREYNPLLEEYVDCLHFILSIGLTDDLYEDCEQFLPGTDFDITNAFLRVFEQAILLHDDLDVYEYQCLLEHFFVLGRSLGFTFEQIEQAYISKNAVNHERQNNGY